MNAEIISNEQVSSLERIAAIVAKSGMGGFKTPEQATVAMLLALAEGIPLGRIIHEYHVINGRLSLRSECMLARFQKAGGVIQYVTHTDTEVSVTASHPKGGALTVTWTIERARKAGLTSNPTWAKHPAAMLTARAITEAVRAVYPACLSGIITEDEAVEITAQAPAPVIPEPALELEAERPCVPAPREYFIGNGERYAAPTRRGRKGNNGSKRPAPLPAPESSKSDPAPTLPSAGYTDQTPAPQVDGDSSLVVSAHASSAEYENVPDPAAQEGTESPQERSTGLWRAPEPETKRTGPNTAAFYHPLDEHLAGLDQNKLTAFLLKQGFITEDQNYKWCGPNATSRILKQLPSFLKAAGLEAVTA